VLAVPRPSLKATLFNTLSVKGLTDSEFLNAGPGTHEALTATSGAQAGRLSAAPLARLRAKNDRRFSAPDPLTSGSSSCSRIASLPFVAPLGRPNEY